MSPPGGRIVGCVNGPWQAVMLAAAIEAAGRRMEEAEILLLAPGASARFRDVCAWISKGLLKCAPREVGGIFTDEEQALDYPQLIRRLKGEVPPDAEIEEVWVSSVFNWREIAVASLFPKAKVFLYEDGMQSVFKFAPGKVRGISSVAKAGGLIRQIASYNGFRRPGNVSRMVRDRRSARQRVEAEYSFSVSRFFPESGCQHITDHGLADAIERTRGILNLSISAPSPCTCVFLAQCFAKQRMLSESEECSRYASIVREVLGKGWRVLWKEHPRTGGAYFERLRDVHGLSVLETFPADPEVPVEVVLSKQEWRSVPILGVASSSMVYLSELYGVSCFTVAADLIESLDPAHQRMALAFQQRYPSLERFPQCRC